MATQSSEKKNCQNCKNDFVIEPEDFSFYEKMQVPPPTFCPQCRLVRRLIWRNERSLYKRACDMCKKKIISMYDDNKVIFPVYCKECWKSDAWDPISYGREYDFSRSFFVQWKELFDTVPRQAVFQSGNNLNTEYTNMVKDVKNVYLAYSIVYDSENVYYSKNVDYSKNIIDSENITQCEWIFESIGGKKNYNCIYSFWSSSCIDSTFIMDCVNCSNCFGCVNLRNKSYFIWNEQYEKEKYFEKLKELNISSFKSCEENWQRFQEFSLNFPKKYARLTNTVNSTGDELRDCNNAHYIFNGTELENVKYGFRLLQLEDCMDICYCGKNASLMYEHAIGGSENSSSTKFTIIGLPALNEVEYIDTCTSSDNLFGCIGLKNKSYCIFNKQYEKEEYFEMVEKIKKHMDEMPYIDSKSRMYKYGEFFPFEFSPFGYNETVINDHFPITKDEAQKMGYPWKEKNDNQYTITIKASDLPDDIKDVDDSILNETIECEVTKKPYKITNYELEFYRRMNIPLPRLHQDERYRHRLMLKNPMRLWHRSCMNKDCKNEFETTYAPARNASHSDAGGPERPEIVFCEKCYQQEVY
ncbi:MAG: hypothetical protein AAB873_01590 [Patescibacteria group bacterium]